MHAFPTGEVVAFPTCKFIARLSYSQVSNFDTLVMSLYK